MCGWRYLLFKIFQGEAGDVSGKFSAAVKDVFCYMRVFVTAGWEIYLLGYCYGYLFGSVDESLLNVVAQFWSGSAVGQAHAHQHSVGMLGDGTANLLIAVPAVLGVIWSAKDSKAKKGTVDIVAETTKIAKTIQDGAMSLLFAEYTYMAVYIVIFSGVLIYFTGVPTTVAFVVGAVTSIICGWIGMKIAVYTNVKTTHQAWRDLSSGFVVPIQGGCVMGLSLASIGVLALFPLVEAFRAHFKFESPEEMYEALAGYGLGGSSIALFGRVGGGIYTKAADVGADLSGKNDYGLEEDDYRNPACIAANVDSQTRSKVFAFS